MAKRAARRFLGPLYDPLQRLWSGVRHRLRERKARARHRRILTVLTREGVRIAGGPFAGMQYVPEAAEGPVYPKLAGTYELELFEIIERIVTTPYDVVVNVGAGDGYYAVGLALRMPHAVVHAFDTDPEARRVCEHLAHVNGVGDRVRVEAGLETFDLPHRRLLVVCDCEGCELAVLDPGRDPVLKEADILVELHDFIDGAISTVMRERFAVTHDIAMITSCSRDGIAPPSLKSLSSADRRFAMDERRPGRMQWAWMVARQSGQSSVH